MKNENKMTEKELEKFLNSHGVDTSVWGTGGYKAIKHLLSEIKDGEIVLSETKDGTLKRTVNACSCDLYYTDSDGARWKLREHERIMLSGAVKKMTHEESVRGKMKGGEDPAVAIRREIEEELGIPPNGYAMQFAEVRSHGGISTNYPNLFSYIIAHHFTCFLKKEYFKESGYVEKKTDYSIYFMWERVVFESTEKT